MTRLVNPIDIYLDGRGLLLDGGYIFIGEAGTDPEVGGNQLALYSDKARTVPIAQPLRTLGGVIVNGMNLAKVYLAEADYSITVRDADMTLVYAEPSAFDTGGTTYQPHDADLDAIVAQVNHPFGFSLLTAVNAAALRVLAGLGSIATLAKATAAEFLSNTASRALAVDTVWGAAASVDLTSSSGHVAIDLNTGINFTLAMSENTTLDAPTHVKDGQGGKIEITQNASAAKTLSFATGWVFVGGADPAISTALNAFDVLYYQGLSNGKVQGSLNKALA